MSAVVVTASLEAKLNLKVYPLVCGFQKSAVVNVFFY